jgi:hypothetical protein
MKPRAQALQPTLHISRITVPILVYSVALLKRTQRRSPPQTAWFVQSRVGNDAHEERGKCSVGAMHLVQNATFRILTATPLFRLGVAAAAAAISLPHLRP